MTNNTLSQTKSDALKHIETQITFAESLIDANRVLIRTLDTHFKNREGYSLRSLAEDRDSAQKTITRAEGRIAGLAFAREEILAIS